MEVAEVAALRDVALDLGDGEQQTPAGVARATVDTTPREGPPPSGPWATKRDVARLRAMILNRRKERSLHRACRRVFDALVHVLVMGASVAFLGWVYFSYLRSPRVVFTVFYFVSCTFLMGSALVELVRAVVKLGYEKNGKFGTLRSRYVVGSMRLGGRLLSFVAVVTLIPFLAYVILSFGDSSSVYISDATHIAKYIAWFSVGALALSGFLILWKVVLLSRKMGEIREVVHLEKRRKKHSDTVPPEASVAPPV